MKIYLGVNTIPMDGYTNLDPCGGQNKILVEPSNLDYVCDDASCTHFVADEILDYIHGSKLLEALNNWKKKLRLGATIVLGGTEIGALARTIYSGKVTVVDANKILFGYGDNPWAIKSGCYSCYDISAILRESGLLVVKQKIVGIKFVVEAQRV